MNLVVPTVSVDSGLVWEQSIEADLGSIDSHNHTSGYGVQIPVAGLNINSDLPIQDNNVTLVRSLRFQIQGSPISGAADLSCLYATDSNGDLWYNDGSGNQIQITKSGVLNVTSSGISSGTASASFVAGVLVVDAASLTPANIQVASVLLGNNVASSNYLTLSPPNAMASSYSLVLPSVPSVLSPMTLDNSGNMGTTTWDQIGVNMTSVGADAIANSRTRGVANQTAGIGGIVGSPSCGNFTTNSTGYVNVTNLNGTISTSGRPVVVFLTADGSSNASTMETNSETMFILLQRNSATIAIYELRAPTSTITIPSSSFYFMDTGIAGAPGGYTYNIQIRSNTSGTVGILYSILNAYEI
jgi:predicted secreted protein